MLTSRQVESDFRARLLSSPLGAAVGGRVYFSGTRPRDSRDECATVVFTAGLPGQIETGSVTVNVYVPDIDPWGNGMWTEDMERTAEIEAMASEWVDGMSGSDPDYHVTLADSIHTTAEPETRQHFVVARLKYKYLTENQYGY